MRNQYGVMFRGSDQLEPFVEKWFEYESDARRYAELNSHLPNVAETVVYHRESDRVLYHKGIMSAWTSSRI